MNFSKRLACRIHTYGTVTINGSVYIYNLCFTHLREAEVLLPFKKASYVAPPDRSQGPAPKRPRTEAAASETGKKKTVTRSFLIRFTVRSAWVRGFIRKHFFTIAYGTAQVVVS